MEQIDKVIDVNSQFWKKSTHTQTLSTHSHIEHGKFLTHSQYTHIYALVVLCPSKNFPKRNEFQTGAQKYFCSFLVVGCYTVAFRLVPFRFYQQQFSKVILLSSMKYSIHSTISRSYSSLVFMKGDYNRLQCSIKFVHVCYQVLCSSLNRIFAC